VFDFFFISLFSPMFNHHLLFELITGMRIITNRFHCINESCITISNKKIGIANRIAIVSFEILNIINSIPYENWNDSFEVSSV
jgi:hypothetical protein